LVINNRPLEFYGKLVNETNDKKYDFEDDACPFIGKKCVKTRKSNKDQSIGSCIVKYSGSSLIICPHRFLSNYTIFHDSIRYLKSKQKIFAVPEIKTSGGNIDYFIISKSNGKIIDYCGLEIQSLDTTSSGDIWSAREDFLSGKFSRNYKYGINWKMSAKTILIQLHHKGTFFQEHGKKLILVIQKEFYDYLSREFDTSKLHKAKDKDSIQFHIYDCKLKHEAYDFSLLSRKSTDVNGIEYMLKLGKNSEILESKVLEKIQTKLSTSSVIPVN
jgi:hypothetical protein